MKSFKQFLSESINISGDFNGNLYVNGSDTIESPVRESYTADVVWQGKLYRMEVEGEMISKNELTEQLQKEYPGAIVHTMYPSNYSSNNTLRITGIKRYQPEKLSWTE
jgi:hypothetical protein